MRLLDRTYKLLYLNGCVVRREGKADGTYDIMMINEINNIFLLFEVANGELQDDQTYVVAVEAETSDGYSVVSEFSEEVSTLPSNVVPG